MKRFFKRLSEYFNGLERKNLSAACITILAVLSISGFFLEKFSLDCRGNDLIYAVSFLISINFFPHHGREGEKTLKSRMTSPEGEEARRNIDSENLIKVAKGFIEVVEREELFRVGGLSVRDVGERMDIPPYLISRALNFYFGQNFIELINGYRVQYAQKLLKDEAFSRFSVLGIGFEAGFGSKTAFNTAFKKHTGMTPSQFKKKGLEVIPSKHT